MGVLGWFLLGFLNVFHETLQHNLSTTFYNLSGTLPELFDNLS